MKDPRTIEEQATQLARWLEEHPGATPPEGLDPDVLEAIYTLRPDLAPAPSFTIDDILADITAGPFAPISAEPGAEIAQLAELIEIDRSDVQPPADAPAEPQTPTVVDLSTERRRRRPWLWTGVGAMAAAAMALFVVMPFVEQGVPDLMSQAEQADLPAVPPAVDSISTIPELATPVVTAERKAKADRGVPSPDAAAPAQPTGGILDDMSGRAGSGAASGVAAGPALAGRSSSSASTTTAGKVRTRDELAHAAGGQGLEATTQPAPAEDPPAGWYTPSTTTPAPRAAAAPEPEPTMLADEGGERDDQGAYNVLTEEAEEESLYQPMDASTDGALAGATASKELEHAEDDLLEIAGSERASSSGDSFRSVDEDREQEQREGRDDEADDYDEAAEYQFDAGASAARVETARRGLDLTDTRSAGRSTPRTRRSDNESVEAPPAAPAEAIAMGLDELRSQANPLDYHSRWYETDPALDDTTRAQLAAANSQVQAAIVAGEPSAALGALQPLTSSAHPRVVQDVSYHIATLHLQSGRVSSALAAVSTGLAASSSPTVFRSRLLALLGSIHEELGDNSQAHDAYQQAVDANISRY